jgi:hypothetical protein
MNDKFHNLYSLLSIIRMIKSRRMRWVEHVTCMREKRNVRNILIGKPEGRRPHRRPGYRWEDIIKIELKKLGMGGGGMDSFHMAQDRDQWDGSCEHSTEPTGSIKGSKFD